MQSLKGCNLIYIIVAIYDHTLMANGFSQIIYSINISSIVYPQIIIYTGMIDSSSSFHAIREGHWTLFRLLHAVMHVQKH